MKIGRITVPRLWLEELVVVNVPRNVRTPSAQGDRERWAKAELGPRQDPSPARNGTFLVNMETEHF